MPAERTGFPETLAAAREGAEWAWSKLHRDLGPGLRGYFVASSIDDAEDEVGEVFVEAARDLPSFTGGMGEFKLFVYSLAVKRVRAKGQGSGAKHRRQSRRASGAEGELPPHVIAAVRSLDPDQREAVLLARVCSLTTDEVAKVLDVHPDLVRQRQRQGLAALKGSVF